jgi:hypothetical protein
MIHIGRDFANFGRVGGPTTEHCGGFTVAGLSGNYGIFGWLDAYVDLCDLSNPGSFDLNVGTLGANVTFCVCADSCVYHASVDETAIPALTTLTVTPNPADDRVTLNLTSHTKGSAFLIVYNMMGDVIYKKELLLNPGENPLELSLESWSNGLYLISIQQAGERLNAKLIKL